MRRKKGFTLIEFMVAAVIFSLFTYTLYNLFAGGLRAYKKGETITLIKKNASNFLDYLSTDFRSCDSASPDTATAELTIYRNVGGKKTVAGEEVIGYDYHCITYSYDSSSNIITRTDAISTNNGYNTEAADITFGGEENIYFYSDSGAPFTYNSTTETLTVDLCTQSGKTYDNQAWKRLRLVDTYSKRFQGSTFDQGTYANYSTKVFNGNDAIEDPGSPSDRIMFLK